MASSTSGGEKKVLTAECGNKEKKKGGFHVLRLRGKGKKKGSPSKKGRNCKLLGKGRPSLRERLTPS